MRTCPSESVRAPVSGSNSAIDSSSSPKNDSRHARSSRWAGQISRRVAADAEAAAGEGAVVAAVLLGDEVADHLALRIAVAGDQVLGHRAVGLGRADAVDAGHRGDDDDVIAFEKRPGRRVAHPVDLVVDLRFFLDVGVGAGDIGLWLVIVVVGNEILYRVLGKEPLELAVKLRRERLVGGEDYRRALGCLDDLGGGEGLARAGGAEQHLVALSGDHSGNQLGDRRRLVARPARTRRRAGTACRLRALPGGDPAA